MPRDLTTGLKQQANRMFNNDPWVVLFEIQINDTQSVYLTNHIASVTSNGDVYEPFPINIAPFKIDGTVNSVDISVSNISRELIAYVDAGAGISGNIINIHRCNLNDPDDVVTDTLQIGRVKVSLTQLIFTCSYFHMQDTEFPNAYFQRDRCMWDFTSDQCGVDASVPGAGETCTKLLDGTYGCSDWGDREVAAGETRQHPKRFGGFPSLPRAYKV